MIVRCEVVREITVTDPCVTQCDDEALVAMIQRGGTGAERFGQAYAALLERMLPVIRARVNALNKNAFGADKPAEDLMQEGMLGFLQAVSCYKPGRGASVRTFVSICVNNYVTSALRRYGKRERATNVLLEESDLPPGAAATDPQDLFSAMETVRQIMEVIQTELTALERSVMEAYLAGEHYETIARRLHITIKAVDNALQRVRRKLKSFLQG